MELVSVQTSRIQVELPLAGYWGGNKVDLLTGPNGSGKSEALTALATMFQKSKAAPPTDVVVWRRGGRNYTSNATDFHLAGPERVVAQTFSPFTRFAQPAEVESSLTSIYSEGVAARQKYVCIGLHKSTRVVGAGLSKRTLEQALYRMSETPESVETIFEVMRNLELEDSFDLVYEVRPALKRVLVSGAVEQAVEALLSDLEHRISPGATPRTGLSAEFRRTDRGQLAALLNEALDVLGPRIRGGSKLRQHFSAKSRIASRDFAELQSLALLRRFDLLGLKSCELTSRLGRRFDVANASSGEQQMLCSLIGLATALRRESLILIDEPELSLHPRWQLVYIDMLQAAMRPFEGCHVVIATHSPLIVQRGHSLGAGVVQLRGEQPSGLSSGPTSSVEETLLDVFETPIAGSVHLANQIFNAITEAEDGDPVARSRSLRDLERLKSIYSDPKGGDPRSLGLIEEAVDLLNTDEGNNA